MTYQKKKVKVKERLENAFGAFFGDEEIGENTALDSSNETFSIKKESATYKNLFPLLNILKGVILFIPGALFLNTLSFAMTLILLFEIPNMMSPIIDSDFFLRISLILSGGALSTWLGLGSLNNIRHLIIPFSIVSTGFILAIIFGLFTLPYPELRKLIFEIDAFPFYLLPIALIIPNLAKNWVDSLETNEEN
jgi:hypothetical protein